MPRLIIPDENGLAAAVAAWRDGDIVAFPTETVYGLGADATNAEAVARIYAAKGRPAHNPLIAHFGDRLTLEQHVEMSDLAEELAARFWPGPLTLVMNKKPESTIVDAATAGLPTVAVRLPSHPVAQQLLRQFGKPVAAPSANPSGLLTATTPKHVAQNMGDKAPLVIIGGRTPHGLESTIIDVSGVKPKLLRHGAIALEELKLVVGDLEQNTTSEMPAAPGQLLKHYAPRHPLRLNALSAEPDEAFLTFGPHLGPISGKAQRNLSEQGDLAEAAANLFMALHEFDARDDISGIAVMPIPTNGLGAAINDRLHRAAA